MERSYEIKVIGELLIIEFSQEMSTQHIEVDRRDICELSEAFEVLKRSLPKQDVSVGFTKL